MGYLSKNKCPDLDYSLVIEDDDKVAYAYLLKNEKLVGDVWLYNRTDTPDLPEWHNQDKAPFANPKEYSDQPAIIPILTEDDISLNWNFEKLNFKNVEIVYKDTLIARLCDDSKPGWCIWVKKNGPLAKVL